MGSAKDLRRQEDADACSLMLGLLWLGSAVPHAHMRGSADLGVGYFVEFCLEDHVLTTQERLAARQLKRLLHIKEGDLWGLRRREVEELVDRIVDENIRRLAASGARPRERTQQPYDLIIRLDTVYKLRKSQREELLAPPLPPAQQQSPRVG